MKKLFFAITIVLYATSIRAQLTQEWVQTYPGADLGVNNNAMVLDNAGNIYTAGKYYDGVVTSMLLQKHDVAGNLLWSQPFLPSGSFNAAAYAVALDGNGDVIITGKGNGNAGAIVKYDANGQLLWSQTSIFISHGLTTDENNNVYSTSWDTGNNDLLTTKYNASGVQQWTVTYNGPSNASGSGKIIYKNGYVYRTGQVFMHLSGTPPATITPVVITLKYNAANGVQVWAATYSHSDKISQGGSDLVVDAVGNTYVTGFVYNKAGSNQNVNWVTIKYNSAGTQQWVKIYDGNGKGADYTYGITLDNSGNIIVAGESYTTTGQYTSKDMATIKYSPSGSELWVKTFDGLAHTNDRASAMATDASSNIYVTGYSDKNNTSIGNSTTIKYNASGTLLNVANYDGGVTVNDETTCIRLDNGGNIFVGGRTGSSSLLIKYAQSIPPPIANNQILSANTSLTNLNVYPNPVQNQLSIENADKAMLGTITVIDPSGKMVYQKVMDCSQTVIDVQNLLPGIYYLRTDQTEKAIKFVKQ